MHIDRIPVYRVYQRAIDLELYHAFAELVVQTSQDDTARRTYRQTRAMQIWQVETDVSGYFEHIICVILARCWSGLRKTGQ